MVAFTGTLFGYIYATVFHHTLTYVPLAVVCVVFAFVVRLHRVPRGSAARP